MLVIFMIQDKLLLIFLLNILKKLQQPDLDKNKKEQGLNKTPKQMLQRLPISLAQINACNNSQSLLNEIRQIVYSLYQSKEINKKVYNKILKSIKV